MKFFSKSILAPFFGFLIACASLPAAGAELVTYDASHSRVSIALEAGAITPGETGWLAFTINPRKGWHTYWKNSGDSGAAPIFEWHLPEGLSVGAPLFAAPERLPIAHLMNYGFKGRTTILFPLIAAADFHGSTSTVGLTAEWLVCEIECVPQVANWDLKIPTGAELLVGSVSDPIFIEARSLLPELSYWDSALKIGQTQSLLTLYMDESELSGLQKAYFFPETDGVAIYNAEQTFESTPDGLIVHIARERGAVMPQNGAGVLQLSFAGSPDQTFDIEPKLAVMPKAEVRTNVGHLPFWQAALYALFGGLILNLMPCVFPILSLKAFAFVSANYKTATNRRREGWAYTAGIWISFMAIVGVLMALRAGGAAIGWGFQLQEPLFVGLLAILMVLVALSLAGVFTIQLGFEGSGQQLAGREGAQGAFFKGVLATLVATPCTAPLMAPAIGFALTQPFYTVVAVFSLLAFGLALPFLLLSYSARVAAMMPKPGAWMEKVKQGLAFPMLLTAVWLVYVYDLQTGAAGALSLLMVVIFISFSVWLWGQTQSKTGRILAASIGLASLVALSYVSFGAKPSVHSESQFEAAYSEKKLDELLESGQPVFVYFSAEWCITCKVNEQIALFRDETQAALRAKNVQVLKGDWTNRNDEIARVLASYGRAGVPLYLYFPAGSRDAIVLPEVITASSIIDIL